MKMKIGSNAEIINKATEIDDDVSTGLTPGLLEDAISSSDLNFRLISSVHVPSNSQRADSVVQG